MRRPRRRPMYYLAASLRDGTVIASYPIRKPAPRVIKRDHLRIDDDGVAIESLRGGQELSDTRNETRCRFQNIIASNLNTRRAIRELLLPELTALLNEVRYAHDQLDRIEKRLQGLPSQTPTAD